jgi:NADH-quinone oxidoreductase subunit E
VKPEPAAKVVAKAEPAKRVVVKAEPAKKSAAPKVEPAPVAAKTAAPELMPEDFHKPRAMKRPAAPDDLKAISGIGPKLEKVLNDLGVWSYAQVACWGKEEVAWVDDYLSFSGRIGRDKWIEQAAALVAASAKPRKG